MLHRRFAKALRVTTYFALGVGISSALAFAGDDDQPQGSGVIVSPNFTPMTPDQRFHNYLTSITGYESLLRSAASAGIRQFEGQPKEWGGGAEGYGKRLGSAVAAHVVDRTIQYGLSSALHEDNRYILSGQSGFFRRTKYAVKSTLFARHDNGKQYISISRLGGVAGGAFISRAWQPPSNSSAGDGAVSFGVTLSTEIGFNVFREFWPDMKRHLRKN